MTAQRMATLSDIAASPLASFIGLLSISLVVAFGMIASVDDAYAQDKVVRIGFQKYGKLVLLKSKGSLDEKLKSLGYRVAWTEFPSGPPLLEAVNVGAIDFGNTGEALARLAVPFGLRVVAVKRTADDALARTLGLAWLGTMERLPELLAESHFVSLHLPHTPDTVDLLGVRELAQMRQGAYLVNISRAPMLDRHALLDALRSGHLGGAGLDVWWEEPADPADPLLA